VALLQRFLEDGRQTIHRTTLAKHGRRKGIQAAVKQTRLHLILIRRAIIVVLDFPVSAAGTMALN
jgi:hypothetical protein